MFASRTSAAPSSVGIDAFLSKKYLLTCYAFSWIMLGPVFRPRFSLPDGSLFLPFTESVFVGEVVLASGGVTFLSLSLHLFA